MTQLESALSGKVTPQMRRVAKDEKIDPQLLREKIALGEVVIPANRKRVKSKICGIGSGLKVKVNANIGSSQDKASIREELKKLKVVVSAGADAVMDLSTGGDIIKIQNKIIDQTPIPIGTVPIYEAALKSISRDKNILDMKPDDLFAVIIRQAKAGVDFMTLHCGINRESVNRFKKQGRLMNIVSRGGALLAEWVVLTKRENPLYERFDEILEIARTYDITLSLGDGMRPGAIADATDRSQVQELIILGELAQRARKAGVQVMIEGPGHLPLNEIKANVLLQKKLTDNAPFYVLGPLVTDVAPGYDHITGAIGGAIAAAAGADFLCYVTPAEHLRLPSLEDVKEGVIASRIAAHAADLAKGLPSAVAWDRKMSQMRRKRDWKKQIELSIDPVKSKKYRLSSQPKVEDVCTMCGDYCAIKISEKI